MRELLTPPMRGVLGNGEGAVPPADLAQQQQQASYQHHYHTVPSPAASSKLSATGPAWHHYAPVAVGTGSSSSDVALLDDRTIASAQSSPKSASFGDSPSSYGGMSVALAAATAPLAGGVDSGEGPAVAGLPQPKDKVFVTTAGQSVVLLCTTVNAQRAPGGGSSRRCSTE